MLKGAIHIHSTYSDGEFTLVELRDLFRSAGCAFVCMTDHAEAFDAESVRRYHAECESLSDASFCFIPGLEYGCEQKMHILGYGARQLAQTINPQEIIRFIEAQGAISVIAHPKDDHFAWIESFETLPRGIETWNSKYDGRYAPRPGTFALLQRLRERRAGLQAFYGQDLHWRKQFRELFVKVDRDTLTPESILEALGSGAYTGSKAELALPSSGVLPEELLHTFAREHEKSDRIRNLLKRGKTILDRIGIRIPTSIKAQLRRIF
jgi:predicted metal-dependent phosphoesterase TrpH